MQARLHLDNNRDMIEFPDTAEGMEQAKNFRKNNKDFTRRWIRKVLQAYPSQVPLGEVIRMTRNGIPVA